VTDWGLNLQSAPRPGAKGGSDGGVARVPRPYFLATAGVLYAVSVIGTTLSLLVVAAMGLHSLSAALVAVTLANGAASLVRFSLLRGWAYRPLRPQRASVAA